MSGMTASIFISYASRDRGIAEDICAGLERSGLHCWLASRDVPAGDNFQTAVVRAIRAARVMLLVFTAHSNNSDEVKKELALASQKRLTVIPLRLDNSAPSDAFAYELATRQWIDMSGDHDGALERLANRIASILQTPPRTPDAASEPAPAATAPDSTPARTVHSAIAGFGGRPAIAVLPFRYQGAGAAQQEYFVDGITEDIISALSRWRFFPVIARGTMFTFKGRGADPPTVGRQVGARYILEGSIRRGADQVRTSNDLIDVETTETLMSHQYESKLDDIFKLQEELVRSSVGAIEPELLKRERDRAIQAPVHSVGAYDLCFRGMWHHYRYTKQDNLIAQNFFREALAASPIYPHAAAALALTLTHAVNAGWAGDQQDRYQADALSHARDAVQADPRDTLAQYALGTIHANTGSAEEAARHLREAIQLDPSHAAAHVNLGLACCYMNQPDLALPEIELALRLSPYDPRRFQWLPCLAMSHYLKGQYRQALTAAREALSDRPDYPVALRYLLAALGQMGRTTEAAAVVPLVRRLDGDLAGTEALIRARFVPAAAELIVTGLRKSGLG
jgi:adenylate cyclase